MMLTRWYWLLAVVGRLVHSRPIRVCALNRQFSKVMSWMRPLASLMETPFQPLPVAIVQPSKMTFDVVPWNESTAVEALPPVKVHW